MAEIDYTDGQAVEARILDILRRSGRLDSEATDWPREDGEWAVEYHLCPERANLLRPFHFEGLNVLEIGAGMGAVSRFLAERAKHLTVVEGTQARYDCLKERLRDLSNWDGIVGNFQDVTDERRYDVVCVIGVLEYSELFLKEPDPHAAFLRKARSFLKPNGVVVLAIENQLGLKYLNGASEDHLGTLFDGVCGYPDGPTPRTFSRNRLKALLASAGAPHVDEFFPFPDYKVPSSILSIDFLTHHPRAAGELAAARPFRDYRTPGYQRLYPEALASRSFAAAGLLADVSNSFLFLASADEASPIRRRLLGGEQRPLAWYYSNRRKAPVGTVVTDDGGKLRVKKSPLGNTPAEQTSRLGKGHEVRWTSNVREEWIEAPKFLERWHELAYFGGADKALPWLETFLRWSFDRWAHPEDPTSLRGEALDATLANAAGGPDFELFDLEWTLDGPLSKSWFLLRNLFVLFFQCQAVGESQGLSLFDWYGALCTRLGLTPDFEGDLGREAEFQAIATGEGNGDGHRESLRRGFLGRFPARGFPRHSISVDASQEVEALRHRLALRRYRIVDRIHGLVQGMKPLRAIKDLAFRTLSPGRSREDGNLMPAEGYHGTWARLLLDRGKPASQVELNLKCGDLSFPVFLTLDSRGRAARLLKLSRPVQAVELTYHEGQKPRFRFQGISRKAAGARLLVPSLARKLSRPTQIPAWLKQLATSYRMGGWNVAAALWLREMFQESVDVVDEYSAWIRKFDTPTALDRERIAAHIASFPKRPLISVLMPVYNTEPQWLTRAIESVLGQSYENWELCIADDASPSPKVRPLLEALAKRDPRIRVVFRERNGHISEASNSALALARGELIGLLDHDDELSPDALYHVAAEWNRDDQWDLLYSDEDKIDLKGRRYEPHFKPEWNPELFHCYNLITHFCVMRASVVRDVGGFRKGFEGSQDYDLFLRLVDRVGHGRVRHLPFVLYHWRAVPTSTASGPGVKTYAVENARRALREHLERRGDRAEVKAGYNEFHRVEYKLPEKLPLVSVVIGTKDRADLLQVVVDGLLHETDYDALEILVVDNRSTEKKTLDYLAALADEPKVRVLRYDAPFNFSALNNFAVSQARGEILAFLNNDVEIIHPSWLKEMVGFALRPDIGAVGAKLYYPIELIQHAGVILGVGGVAGHSHKGFPRSEAGFIGRLQVTQNVSAVTAACLVTRKAVFDRVGGFDESLAVAFNDVDLCLKMLRHGFRNVWTPFAELYHYESASRGSDQTAETAPRFRREFETMRSRWQSLLDRDPCYSPNLTVEKEDFSLAFPPRIDRPWVSADVKPGPEAPRGPLPS